MPRTSLAVPRRGRLLPATLLAAALAVGSLAGCSSDDSTAGSGDVAVVTSFYPLQWLAERVGGDLVAVTNLTGPGQEPHDLELTVRQTAEVSDADVAVHLSGLQPAVDDAIAQNGPDLVVDAAESANLIPADEHAAEGGHDTDEDHEGHDHGDVDPHFWLDPLRMADVAEALADTLAEADPDHAGDFEANLAQLRADLEALDREYADGLATCDVTTVVVSHEAFGYLTRYGLTFAAIAGLSPDAEPSPAHLVELQDLIEDEGVTTVFSETLASPAMAEALAEDLGLTTGVLDPIEGLSDETAGEDYLSLMRSNLEALRAAGGCR